MTYEQLPDLEDRRSGRTVPVNPFLWSSIVTMLGFAVAVLSPAGPMAFVGLVGVAIGGGLLAVALFDRLS